MFLWQWNLNLEQLLYKVMCDYKIKIDPSVTEKTEVHIEQIDCQSASSE